MLGETVRHYRILGRLGAGGMGEVYRARDERLGREVAVKALPVELAADPERLRRLEAEARAMAAVDHPNVATIHAVEEHEGRVLLVLELVEGETLAELLERRGSLPLTEALELARGVAAGLEAAHALGIVHRDLKPGNVMVGPKGQVKILDFGLAKALELPGISDQDLTHSPTLTVEAATERSVILGTAPYLSPEQARGQAVDARADVWAVGCLLYEMLTGRRAFSRATFTDTIAAVVAQEPDWEAFPAEIPGVVRWVVRRCLEKDPDERLHSIGDVRLLLEGMEEVTAGEPGGRQAHRSRSVIARVTVVALALGAGLGLGRFLLTPSIPRAAEPRVLRFPVFADPDDPQVGFDPSWRLSPDDRLFAYQTVAGPGARPSAIRLRSFEDGTVRELRGTAGARSMTFSPDGGSIAFVDEGRLKRVSLRDGTIETIATLAPVRNGLQGRSRSVWTHLAWTDEGFLVISSWIPRGLWRVDASGGELEELALRDPEIPELGTDHYLSFVEDLPGQGSLLVTLRRLPRDDHVELLSLADGEHRMVTSVGSRGMFLPPGFVTYHHQGKLFAVAFDPEEGRVAGEAVAVLDGVRAGDGTGTYAISRHGSLVYAPAVDDSGGPSLAVARRGEEAEALTFDVSSVTSPRSSPDGQRVIASSREGSDRANLWLFDLERETARRITGEEGNEWYSAWGPDGRLAFQSDREDQSFLDLYVMDPDRPGSTRKVLDGGDCYLQPQEWSPDGLLLYQRSCVASGALDIFTIDVDSGEVRSLRETAAREKHPSVSPDGRWLAFASDLSGEDQVYLAAYPEPGRLIQVSPAGGDGPIWHPSGDGLFYHSGTDIVFVPFEAEAASPLGAPEIAVAAVPGNFYVGRAYDVLPDGRILLQWHERAPIREVAVVLDWYREVALKLEAP